MGPCGPIPFWLKGFSSHPYATFCSKLCFTPVGAGFNTSKCQGVSLAWASNSLQGQSNPKDITVACCKACSHSKTVPELWPLVDVHHLPPGNHLGSVLQAAPADTMTTAGPGKGQGFFVKDVVEERLTGNTHPPPPHPRAGVSQWVCIRFGLVHHQSNNPRLGKRQQRTAVMLVKIEKSWVPIKQWEAEACPPSQTRCGLTPGTEAVPRREWCWWQGPEEATALDSQDVCAHLVTEGPPNTWTAERRPGPSLTSQLWEEGGTIGGKLHNSSLPLPWHSRIMFWHLASLVTGQWLWLFTSEVNLFFKKKNLLNAKESCLARSWTIFKISTEADFLCRAMFVLHYLTSVLMWCPVMRHHTHGFSYTCPSIR